jgi:hypothetical protein
LRVGITSRKRPWAAPPVSTKARMKAVGNNPLARYVGQETGARPPPTPTTTPHTKPARRRTRRAELPCTSQQNQAP